jgi:hypothetical protein
MNTTSDGTIVLRPNYTVEQVYEIIVNNGTLTSDKAQAVDDTTYSAKYDTPVTITSDVDGFYAWAVKTASGMYQIASYSQSYKFYVATDEEYIPITRNADGDYEIADTGEALDLMTIENALPENDLADISSTDFIKEKLDNKAPFVSIQNAKMIENNTKARVYVRITEGSTGVTGYGIIFKLGDSAERTLAANNMLSSGQFVTTLTSKNAITKTVYFKAYVNYDFTYTFESDIIGNSTSASINAVDKTTEFVSC